MRLVSITVTSNREATIGDAIRSVQPWVDAAILVDLGITDQTEAITVDLMAGKPVFKTAIRDIDPGSIDIDIWRNAGLDMARELGFDWAVILDTDERVSIGPKALPFLESTTADCCLVADKDRTYTKERFVRLSSHARYEGNCHEYIAPDGLTFVLLDDAYFYELPKDPETNLKRSKWIIEWLEDYLNTNQEDTRQWLQLAEAYQSIGMVDESFPALKRVIEHTKARSDGAYACFMLAYAYLAKDKLNEAIYLCGKGLTFDPSYAELPCVAAYASLRLGRPHDAIQWANMSLANGLHVGIGSPRGGQSWPPGRWEGPYLALRQAYEMLGMDEDVKLMARLTDQARYAREAA